MVILFKVGSQCLCVEQVVGVPVSLNGDLKNQFVETTVGFDTVCKVSQRRLQAVL